MTVLEISAQVANAIGSTINMIGINSKKKKNVLLFFIFGNLFVSASLGLLGAIEGFIVEVIFVIETIINYIFGEKSDKYPIWLIALYVIVPCSILVFTYESALDILPIVASVLFPLAMLTKNFKLRLLNMFSVAVWVPYNFLVGQYVGTITCTIFTIVNFLAIVRMDILKKREMN